MGNKKHLWEIEHPYHCYIPSRDILFGFKKDKFIDFPIKYNSFDEFLEKHSDSDMDLNLIFRWDWEEWNNLNGKYEEAEEKFEIFDNAPSPFNGDVLFKNGVLHLYIVMQRLGELMHLAVNVCRNDEDRVKEYLKPRFVNILDLWEGIDY